jgi:hypothetical protein
MDESVFDPTYGGAYDDMYDYGGEAALDSGESSVGFVGGSFRNDDGSSQQFNSDGSITYQDPDGSVYTVNPSGTYTTTSAGQNYTYDPKQSGFVDSAGKLIEGGINSSVAGKSLMDKMIAGIKANPVASAVTGAAGLKALYDLFNKEGGYNVPVPKIDMTRAQVPYAQDPNRAPGAAGRQYFTNPQYTYQGQPEALAAAQEAANEQARGIMAAAPKYAAAEPNPYAGKIPTAFSQPRAPMAAQSAGLPSVPTPEQYAAQGTLNMAKGGKADAGRYLQGSTDGMADEIPSSIDGEQPAALSHGEFVVPADVVSHLGNGNSEAGAEKLYEMMARIRQARTGTTEQGKEINPDEFTMGGLASAYAGGGAVQRFNGAVNGSAVLNPTVTNGQGIPLDTSRTSTLSPWVGDYVTNALGQGAALSQAPYQAYQGPLTAGASNLQQQAFAGASDLASAGYQPGQFTGGFGAQQANQYMNPYLQASLDPQLKELKRQSDIARLSDASRMTQAGAFGGSRQAIMESEGRRNLLDKQADLLGQGYKSAYDTGLGQFNKEREAEEASRQFGANYGLKTVDQLANLGNVQRGITAEGLAADKGQFEEQRDFAYKMPQYQLGLLSGLPIGAQTASVNPDLISKLQSDTSGLLGLYKTLTGLGQTPAATAPK